ncbi:hypothetical protein J6590_029389 [Homalodisca vitripennis]|nr:hypothetical protein J6590_029389 [Homalodisca vitripennis]
MDAALSLHRDWRSRVKRHKLVGDVYIIEQRFVIQTTVFYPDITHTIKQRSNMARDGSFKVAPYLYCHSSGHSAYIGTGRAETLCLRSDRKSRVEPRRLVGDVYIMEQRFVIQTTVFYPDITHTIKQRSNMARDGSFKVAPYLYCHSSGHSAYIRTGRAEWSPAD